MLFVVPVILRSGGFILQRMLLKQKGRNIYKIVCEDACYTP